MSWAQQVRSRMPPMPQMPQMPRMPQMPTMQGMQQSFGQHFQQFQAKSAFQKILIAVYILIFLTAVTLLVIVAASPATLVKVASTDPLYSLQINTWYASTISAALITLVATIVSLATKGCPVCPPQQLTSPMNQQVY